MPAHLLISDTQVTIGEERLVAFNPMPELSSLPPLNLDDLVAMQAQLVSVIHALEARIVELERRTWWSMLKDQIRSWFR